MKRRRLSVAAVLVVLLAAGAPANASPIIVSYDILNAAGSGWGGWAHTYSGTITTSPISFFPPYHLDYTGGSGTLNDGSHGTSPYDTQLFAENAEPVITLYLDDYYAIDSLSVFGGDFTGNVHPGRLGGMRVGFGGLEGCYGSTPFGFPADSGPASDLFTITGPLSGVATNQIPLDRFSGDLVDRIFSIAEIEVAGHAPEPIPEPASLLLFGTGLVGLRAWRKRRQ